MAAAEKLKVAVIAAVLLILGLGVTVLKMRAPASPSTPPVVAAAAPGNGIPEPERTPAVVAPVKAIAKAPTTTSAADQFTGFINFADGSTVELLGLQTNPSSESRWWTADGMLCGTPPHRGEPPSEFDTNSGRKLVWLIMRVNADPNENGRSMKVEVVPSLSSGVSVYSGTVQRSIEATALVSASATTAEVRVGMAAGPWVNDEIYDAATKKSGATKTLEGLITNITIGEEDGNALVGATWIIPPTSQRDHRITAMAGEKIVPISRSTNKNFASKYYFDCGKGEITQVLFQSRPYEIMAIKNVSLAPTTTPTHVSISAASAQQ